MSGSKWEEVTGVSDLYKQELHQTQLEWLNHEGRDGRDVCHEWKEWEIDTITWKYEREATCESEAWVGE
jgi:hypothetical protein